MRLAKSEKSSAPRAEDDVAARATEGMLGPNPFVGLRSQDVLEQFDKIAAAAAKQPQLILAQQAALARELMAILLGTSEIAPSADDKRFRDTRWQDHPLYKMYLQSYLAWARGADEFVGKLGLDEKNTQRARFAVSLVADAFAPSNFLWTNPVALKRVAESNGASVAEGLRNMMQDLLNNQGMPAQVDKSKFEVGKNLAISPGAVVFRNPVLELIQYRPLTESVFARPLIIVPPQINKFYLFDLAPGRSVIEYLLKSGFQMFVVSWRNPTAEQHDWNMDTYVDALLQAIDAAREITNSEDVNIAGACSGAMTVSALLGHIAARGDRPIAAVTMMVVVLDRDEDSQIGLFATPEAIAAAKQASKLKGVLSGQDMARMFAWMRPNDLVWNYWVNNYLLGHAPPAFDVLYWNNDTTRLPASFHGQLLDIFLQNLFRVRGSLTVFNTPIDLGNVRCDKYVVAGLSDHITPWRGVYRAARLFGGAAEFVLSSSGHIQSIINPPGNAKATFFVSANEASDADTWFAGAKRLTGSWWDHWRQWLVERSGARVSAPLNLGNERHTKIVDAPGTYVLER
jgi:poly[(R)-3-hydroxyalkanoate] polymerase subunit PhaC